MGCAQSQQPQDSHAPALDFSMDWTKISEFDEVFQRVADPLKTLLREKNAYTSANRSLKTSVGVKGKLQQRALNDTLMAMMYCYSTACDGNFLELKLTKVRNPPYVDVDRSKLRKEFQPIPPAFERFVTVLTQAIENLGPLHSEIVSAADACVGMRYVDFPERASSLASGTGLGIIDTGKAVLHTKNNVQKLLRAKTLIQKILKKSQDVKESLEHFADMLEAPGAMEEIERIGKAAFEAQCFSPEKIITEFWPDRSRVIASKSK